MKNKKIIIVSALFAGVLAVSGGFMSMKSVQAETQTLEGFTVIDGMSIRTANPEGLRFTTEISETTLSGLTNVTEIGTVLMPAKDVSGELTLNTANCLPIPTEKWIENYSKAGYDAFYSVLGPTEGDIFPEAFYNTPISARAYVKYGNAQVAYSENTVTRSIAYVAKMCAISQGQGYDSDVVEKIAAQTSAVLTVNDGSALSLLDVNGYEAVFAVGGTEVVEMNGFSVEWSVEGEAVTVENGLVKPVSVGTAKVIAKAIYNGDETKSLSAETTVVVEPQKISVLNAYDYEKYTGLNGAEKVSNTQALVVDLTQETDVTIADSSTVVGKLVNGSEEITLTNVSVADNKLTLAADEASSIKSGEYRFVASVAGYEITVPVTVWNKVITQADDLVNMLKYTDYLETKSWAFSGTSYSADAVHGYFKLGKNLDMTGKTLENAGAQGSSVYYPNANVEGDNGYIGTLTGFNGVFDGDGYTISNATFTSGGMFGFVSRNATIKNVAIVNSMLTGNHYSSVLGTGVFGRIENVLIDVGVDAIFGTLAGYGMRYATLTDVIIYFNNVRTDGLVSNIEGPWAEPNENTIDNVQVFTNVEVKSNVTGKYASDATLSTAVSAGTFDKAAFDSTIWDLSGDKAAFVKVPKTLIVTNVYDYEKYTGLNDTQKISNDANLVIDLTSATEKNGKGISIAQNATYMLAGNTLSGVTVDGLKLTVPASQINNLAGGEYSLTVSATDYSLSIPVTVWNKVITTQTDLINMLKYCDNVRTLEWELWGGAQSGNAYDGYFKLGKNLDMTGYGALENTENGQVYYALEGYSDYNGTLHGFNGVFDGDGYTISNATFTAGGLFGFVSRNATIKNVAIVNGVLNSNGGQYSSVLGMGVFGTLENVLIDVDASNSVYGNIAGYGMQCATLTDVIIYFKGPTTGYTTELDGPWHELSTNTIDNVQVFTALNVHSSVTGKYAYDATLSTAVAAGTFDKTAFDSTIWDLSGDKAAFVAKN